jgi:outer membrane protein OmpA-like peptidoglycan-associated protein
MNAWGWGTLAAAALVLTGCAPTTGGVQGWLTGDAWDLERVEALPMNPDPYFAALQQGYLGLAKAELDEFDWDDSALFLSKARAAALAEVALPDASVTNTLIRDALTARARSDAAAAATPPTDPASVGVDDNEAITAATQELAAYVQSEGPMLRASRQIAEAQVHYECWLHEVSEGKNTPTQVEQIELCRESYTLMITLIRDLANLPDDMVVVLPEDGEIGGVELTQGATSLTLEKAFAAAGTGEKLGGVAATENEIKEAFAGALASRPPPPTLFEIFFEVGRTKITDEGFEQILKAVEDVKSRAAAEVLVTGYADAPGDGGYNLALSRTRAARVQEAIFKELRAGEVPPFSVEAKGEKDLAIETPKSERSNRRVLVLVR